MKDHNLELIFTHTSYVDLTGELHLVGRLVSLRWGNTRRSELELAVKSWDAGGKPPVAVWRSLELKPSDDQLEPLIEHALALWGDGRTPQITFEPAAGTGYDGIVLAVQLGVIRRVLHLVPVDGIRGSDGGAVLKLLEALADMTGPLRRDFPLPIRDMA